MKQTHLTFFLALLVTGSGALLNAQDKGPVQQMYSAGVQIGYNRGYGSQFQMTLHNGANELPFDLRLGLGYTLLNPGNAADARRIFINNATNGEPEKSGRSVDYRLDFVFAKPFFGLKESYLVLGPRGSAFKGNFKYIGGNEDFDVTSHQWGLGAGLETRFGLSGGLKLVLSGGLDGYLPSTLRGHDTAYSPDNDNVNPRDDNQNGDEEFTYRDADRAISQPRFMPYALIGVNFPL
ncbi:MAG: hypothetical protein R2751_00895 [Bacteroidales bacterium]